MDISQFHTIFLEEATEHLEALESGLLELEQSGETDMNGIFRAAHSIKGGAATFGFDNIADFTHVAESVLEKARDGEIEVTEELTSLFLTALDIISEMVNAAKEDRDPVLDNRDECLNGLNAYLTSGAQLAQKKDIAEEDEGNGDKFRILNVSFKPKDYFMQTGSEPVNIMKELASLGEIDVTCHTENVDYLDHLQPDGLYLWWEIELETVASDEEVKDVFIFVEDDADIEVVTIAALDRIEKEEREERRQSDRREGDRRTDDRRQGDRRKAKAAAGGKSKESMFIRVSIDKVDSLINMVGELITTQAMVEQRSQQRDPSADDQEFNSVMNELASHTRNLQETIMSIRMMPIDFAFSRFPRMVRDTANKLGKKINLETHGSQTELDKTVIEKISDPLTHLVRNSIDHGVEKPEVRAEKGKPEEGTVILSAYYRGGNVIVEIKDDGAGLSRERIVNKALDKKLITEEQAEKMPDSEVWQLIFNSGFSTAAEVTDVSGRGVGMDVVRKNIQELGGTIQIESEQEKGSCFRISLPLTLAIVDGMAMRVGEETYIVPLLNIQESIRPSEDQVKTMQNGVEVVNIRGEYLPLLRLSEVFRIESQRAKSDLQDGITMIVESDQTRIALFIDDLLGERQVVIKSLKANYKQVEGISGATIMGDGKVAFIVDIPGLISMAKREGRYLKEPFMKNTPPQAVHAEIAQVV